LTLLDRAAIGRNLGAQAARFTLEVRAAADSTNTVLLGSAAAGAPSGAVLAVEWQPGGRGRLGRAWHAGVASRSLFLSCGALRAAPPRSPGSRLRSAWR